MLRPAQTIAEKMLKVDHTGENGAVNIYRAQAISAHLFARDLIGQIRDNQRHEEQHRQIFADQLRERDVRRCVSFHVAGAGGFMLGFLTGLMGRKAIHATTYAVEHVVLRHLDDQLSYLENEDPLAFGSVSAIVADEKEHHDQAQLKLSAPNWLSSTLIVIVKFCTEAVIRFGMR